MLKFLKSNTGFSSTRLALLIGMIIAILLGGSMSFNIIYNTVVCSAVNWTGQATMLTALTAFVGSLIWGKVNQKKYETTNSDKRTVSGNNYHVVTNDAEKLPE